MGKPLISDTAMLGMYSALQRLHAARFSAPGTANRKHQHGAHSQGGAEAVLTALHWQLHRRDTLLLQQSQVPSVRAAQSMQEQGNLKCSLLGLPLSPEECAGVAAGMALQQQRSVRSKSNTTKPVVIACLSTLPALTGILKLIQDKSLSVLLITQGEPETRADAQRRQLGTQVPVMPVDGSDIVALCRVTQECLLRARNGWGGTILHALRLPNAGEPISLLEAHLRKRGISTDVGTTVNNPGRLGG